MTDRLNQNTFRGWSLICLMAVIALAGVSLFVWTQDAWAQSATGYANAELLVEPEWLIDRIRDENASEPLHIIDVRGEALFLRGHIPGAVSLSTRDLDDIENPVSGMLIGAEEFETMARNVGINDDSIIVIYDQNNSLSASRLFYALELYGHRDKVRILNGGFAAWTESNLPLENGPAEITPGNFTARFDDNIFADVDYILDHLDDENVVLLDVRSRGEFTGEDVRANRGGHIPGAIHIDWRNALVDEPINRFKSPEELINLYEGSGVSPDAQIVPYCQTNVRGAHTYFVLRLLGYEDIKPYEGSWSEWGNRDDVPIATGGGN